MEITEPTRKLLYQYEVLRSKLELKNHFFESAVRDIYEQTGQVLSLVRFRLATVTGNLNEHVKPDIEEAGSLIGDAISRLRKISRTLSPEQEILTDSGFIKTLSQELGKDLANNTEILQVVGTPTTLAPEPAVILLAIILNVISSIRNSEVEQSLRLIIKYTEKHLLISINYRGNPIDLGFTENLNDNDLSTNLNLQQRLTLIHGSIVTESGENNKMMYQIEVLL